MMILLIGVCSPSEAKGLKRSQRTRSQPTITGFSQGTANRAPAQENDASAALVVEENFEITGSSLYDATLFRADFPDRKLSAEQAAALAAAVSDRSCSKDEWKGTSDLSGWVEVLWVPDEESAAYASDFIGAFGGMDAKGAGTCGRFAFASEVRHSGRMKGTFLIAPDWEHPSRMALLIKKAFDNTHIPFEAVSEKQIPPAGLSHYGVAILVGAK